MSRELLNYVVYFKNIIECEQFLTYIQNNTSIKWKSNRKPLEKDIEDMMYGRNRKFPFAIGVVRWESNTALECGSKSSYQDLVEYGGHSLKIISFPEFLSKFQKYRRF